MKSYSFEASVCLALAAPFYLEASVMIGWKRKSISEEFQSEPKSTLCPDKVLKKSKA